MNTRDRIDKLIAGKYNISRNDACILIEEGKVFLHNRKITKPHSKIEISDINKINIDRKDIDSIEKFKELREVNLRKNTNKSRFEDKEDFTIDDINIVYEDENILGIDKPKGLVVYSGVGKEKCSVVSLLQNKYKLSDLNGVERKGIVHRLDKDTSGLMLIAKKNQIHKYLEKIFKDREVEKIYLAIVRGEIQESKGKIDMPIGRSEKDFKKMEAKREGKDAITYFEVLERFNGYTLVKINIITGRSHQIRVHFSKIGYPILGDLKYSNGKNNFGLSSQLLHSYSLKFKLENQKEIYIKTDIPDDFNKVLKILRNKEVR